MKTRLSSTPRISRYVFKIILPISLLLIIIYFLGKIDMPAPNKLIKQEIPNDQLIILK